MSKEHGLLDLRHKQPKRVEFVANYNGGISKSRFGFAALND